MGHSGLLLDASNNSSAELGRRDFDQSLYEGIDWSLANAHCERWQLDNLQHATEVAILQMLNPAALDNPNDNVQWVWFFKDEAHANDGKG